MEDLENPAAPVTTPSPESDLQAQVDSLQRTVTLILVLTIIVCGALMLFVRRQANLTGSELAILRPQKAQIDAQYQKLIGPDVETFGRKLAEYGATHPDFAPIMAKYGLTLGKATSAPPARVTAPSTLPAPTKK